MVALSEAGCRRLEPPTKDKLSWNFDFIDPALEDFMKATEGHTVLINFQYHSAWMWMTDKPVTYPDDPNEVYWGYTQGRSYAIL